MALSRRQLHSLHRYRLGIEGRNVNFIFASRDYCFLPWLPFLTKYLEMSHLHVSVVGLRACISCLCCRWLVGSSVHAQVSVCALGVASDVLQASQYLSVAI